VSPDEVRRALDRAVTVDITTTGRRSGRATRIEIWTFKVDGVHIITGTPGPRDWYANLLAEPTLTVHLKDDIRIDLEAVATPVLDEGRRRTILAAPETAWYRTQATLDELVMGSPLVELSFSLPPAA
jgi:deazaflavin-dependent oxidoreductase (nitroreductase family)